MKTLGKLLGWFFNLGNQYDREKRRYYRKGYVRKILSLLILPIMAGLAVLAGYGTLWLFTNLEIGAFFFLKGAEEWMFAWLKFFGAIVLAYATIALALNVFSLLIQRTIIAFKAAKDKKKSQEAQGPKETLAEGETHVEQIEAVEYKTSRGFDIFYGVTCLLLLLGIVGAIAIGIVILLS